jgi:hypothetical protein
MRFFTVILTLVMEFILLYLMFAFGQWNMNAYEWGNELRCIFSGIFIILGFFSTLLFYVGSDNDFDL